MESEKCKMASAHFPFTLFNVVHPAMIFNARLPPPDGAPHFAFLTFHFSFSKNRHSKDQ
jgi:hypothetical protein